MVSPSNVEVVELETPLIVGSGLSALTVALYYDRGRPITILTDQLLGASGSTVLAQGGIAAAVGDDDDPYEHALDTLSAGGYLGRFGPIQHLTTRAREAIDFLVQLNVPFDRDEHNRLSLGLEGAHSRRRIVRIGGDQTGFVLMQNLTRATRKRSNVRVLEHYTACEIYQPDNRAAGVYAFPTSDPSRIFLFLSPAIILCTGGIGHLYSCTTNPPQARGDGLAMGIHAGCAVENLEFVQFHPTALLCNADPLPLLTEALRGEGAVLINEEGERFMKAVGPMADLSSRDIVARAIARQKQAGHNVFMDVRNVKNFAQRFPSAQRACQRFGYNPEEDLLPITPAAHYHMGGIRVDRFGSTNVPGIRACGEVSSTGVHGANRLASNSLLESLVYGATLARNLLEKAVPRQRHTGRCLNGAVPPPRFLPLPVPRDISARVRKLMQDNVGVLRCRSGLLGAIRELEVLDARYPPSYPLSHILSLCLAIARAALARRESIGSHRRDDTSAPAEKKTL